MNNDPYQQALKNYTASMRAMEDYRLANRSIFAQYESLAHAAIGTRARLEDEAYIANRPISDGNFEVELKPQPLTFADIEVIYRLIAEGKIPPALRDEIVVTTQRPPHISIRPVKEV